jgi:hypothetical protein
VLFLHLLRVDAQAFFLWDTDETGETDGGESIRHRQPPQSNPYLILYNGSKVFFAPDNDDSVPTIFDGCNT